MYNRVAGQMTRFNPPWLPLRECVNNKSNEKICNTGWVLDLKCRWDWKTYHSEWLKNLLMCLLRFWWSRFVHLRSWLSNKNLSVVDMSKWGFPGLKRTFPWQDWGITIKKKIDDLTSSVTFHSHVHTIHWIH